MATPVATNCSAAWSDKEVTALITIWGEGNACAGGTGWSCKEQNCVSEHCKEDGGTGLQKRQ